MTNYCPYCVSPLEEGRRCSKCNFAAYYRPQAHQLQPGSILHERYLVGRVLGEGGFGITYIGRDLTLDVKVAIKEYFPSKLATRTMTSTGKTYVSWTSSQASSEGRQRFINEAKALASMVKETAVVGVSDFFEENNSAYIVMEYVEGFDLKRIVKTQGKPAPVGELLELLKPVFQALDHLHKQGLIHRDISPDNIMIENGKARLIDFGCARDAIRDAGGETALKHCFSPIEQYRNEDLGPWSDVYAMAATIYYCITGKLPPAATDRLFQDEIVPPSALGAKLTKKQQKALMKALAVMPKDRYQSMEAFGKDLFAKPFPVKQTIAAACAVVALVVGAVVLINRKPDTVVVSGDKTVTQILSLEDNLSGDEKKMLTQMTELLEKNATLERAKDNSSYYQIAALRNDTDFDLTNVIFRVEFYDDKGTMLGNTSSNVESWEKGKTVSPRFYCGSSFDTARIKVLFDGASDDHRLKTGYLDMAMDLSAKSLDIRLKNELPAEITYSGYSSSITYEISSMDYDTSLSTSGYYVTVRLGGACINGSSDYSGNLYYRLTDEDGTVYDSGSVYNIPRLATGERFENITFSMFNLKEGVYYLELGGEQL